MNREEIRIVGMSRSGNHAVIDWILSQAQGRTCFVNCAEPKQNPFATARPLADRRRMVANYAPFDAEAEVRGELSAKDLLVYSYEDCYLGAVASAAFEDRHDRWVGPSLRRTDVLILRDPYNLFASRIRAGFNAVSPAVAKRIWKQHAREFLGVRRYLNQRRVFISYNRWVMDRDYRRRVAEELRLPFSDAARHRVPATGNGSSFDGVRYDGRAHIMRTLERWRHFAADQGYAALFDAQVRALSRRIFQDVGYAVPGVRTPDVSVTRPA